MAAVREKHWDEIRRRMRLPPHDPGHISREELQAAMDRDAAAFEAVLQARRLPKESEAEERTRETALEKANQGATEVPLGVAGAAVAVLDHLRRLAPLTSPAMASDLRTGVHLAVAALRGALEHVHSNLESLRDPAFQRRAREQAGQLEGRLTEELGAGSGQPETVSLRK